MYFLSTTIFYCCNCIQVVHIYKNWITDSQLFFMFNSITVYCLGVQMKSKNIFNNLLKQRGYSLNTIDKLWKWYDYSERKGVASF